MSSEGTLFVVSAPSGTGKTTVVERLVERVPDLVMSRSFTSRPARPGEHDGVDYNFISRPAFEGMIARGAFLEWAEVFGNLYGTGASQTDALLTRGCDVVLVIDVQGARQVRSRREVVSVFVLPPSFQALEQRLRGRSQDPEAQIRKRLEAARFEASAFADYDYVVVNDDRDRCVDRLSWIVGAERARCRRMADAAQRIIQTFHQAEEDGRRRL